MYVHMYCIGIWNLQRFSLTHFWEKFPENNVFAKVIAKGL